MAEAVSLCSAALTNSAAPERCNHLSLITYNISFHPRMTNIQTSASMFLPHFPSCLGGNLSKHLQSYFIISLQIPS